MKNLISHIKNYISLTISDEEKILSKIHLLSVPKKEIIERDNTIHNKIYFVKSGCLHLSHLNESGNQQTVQFAIPDWWITDYDSFNYHTFSKYNIQALEKSELFYLTKADMTFLLSEIPGLERYFRLIAERAYSAALYRISLIFSTSKEERYLKFVGDFPDFVNQVPQYVLASFLGISAEYLSEIRKNQSRSFS